MLKMETPILKILIILIQTITVGSNFGKAPVSPRHCAIAPLRPISLLPNIIELMYHNPMNPNTQQPILKIL